MTNKNNYAICIQCQTPISDDTLENSLIFEIQPLVDVTNHCQACLQIKRELIVPGHIFKTTSEVSRVVLAWKDYTSFLPSNNYTPIKHTINKFIDRKYTEINDPGYAWGNDCWSVHDIIRQHTVMVITGVTSIARGDLRKYHPVINDNSFITRNIERDIIQNDYVDITAISMFVLTGNLAGKTIVGTYSDVR